MREQPANAGVSRGGCPSRPHIHLSPRGPQRPGRWRGLGPAAGTGSQSSSQVQGERQSRAAKAARSAAADAALGRIRVPARACMWDRMAHCMRQSVPLYRSVHWWQARCAARARARSTMVVMPATQLHGVTGVCNDLGRAMSGMATVSLVSECNELRGLSTTYGLGVSAWATLSRGT